MHVSLTLGANAVAVLWKIVCHGSKISESAFFEFASNAINLRFTSPNRTTHLCVKFPVLGENIFTSNYHYQSQPLEVADEWSQCSEFLGPNAAHFMCRPLILALKPCAGLTLLRSSLEYDSKECVLSISNQYTKGLSKKFNLTTSEASLEKPVEERQLECVVVCEAQQMNKILDVFPSHLTRLTMRPEENIVNFKAESAESLEMPSMDSLVSAGCETFSQYSLSSGAPRFSKTFDPKGLRVFVDLASYFNQTFRLEAGPGTHPVSLELEASNNGVLVMSMLIASYDELGMQSEKAGEGCHKTITEVTHARQPRHEVAGRIHSHVSQMDTENTRSKDDFPNISKRRCSQISNPRLIRKASKETIQHNMPTITFSQGISQRTPAPQIRSATEFASSPSAEEGHHSKKSVLSLPPVAEEVLPEIHGSVQITDSPLRLTEVESCSLAEKYGQGKFPLRMSVEQLHTVDKDQIQQSVDSFYENEMFSLENEHAPDMF
ncbi:hypothetical protein XU18_4904 [Perkinsela sp. CCAP 1560/4]|nr:hypothetical protein XU18_4904 [Perkinsela sp. CCAP 1560/4]|eukprot:KNH03828.1 hypothetical protein XU18_4904 [Perkinsela sp. CCAP 1560/4]